MRATKLVLATAALSSLPARLHAEPRALTLEEVSDMARTRAPDLALTEKAIDAAELGRSATGRLRLPRVTVEGNVLLWNEALEFEIDPMAPPFTVREQVTSQVSVTAALPLSAQLVLRHAIAADDSAIDEARANHDDARRQLAGQAAALYIQLLSARSSEEIARVSLAQLQAQRDRARILQQGGALERVDVMRLDAAVANAQLQALQIAKGVGQIEAGLALVLGLPEGTRIEARDPLTGEPRALPEALRAAIDRDVSARPDLRAALARADQARSGAQIARADLFPEINAVATYQNNQGGGTLQPKNAWFVGVTATWNVWDWGHTWKTYKQAQSRAAIAAVAVDRAGDRARLEARNLLLDVDTAFAGLAAARAARAAADEALRIQDERFKVGKATTTDLLDAQSEATRARLGYATSRFAYYGSLIALATAVGKAPTFYLSQL